MYTCEYYAFSDSNDLSSVATTATDASDVIYVPTDNTVASNTEILPYLVVPMLVFFFRQYLMGIPKDFLDAARVDGCTEYGIFFKIMIPLMKPSFAAMGIYQGMQSWNNFLWPMIVTNSIDKITRDVQVSLLELKKLGISFDCSSYRVAVFDMDTYSEMYQVDMHKQQESALMSFVLFNISNEIVTRENAGVAYQEGSNRVCIIFTGCRSREFGDKIHSICQEIQQKVKEVIGIETSIGIGSWVRSPQELVYSYKLAEKAIGYRYLLGGSLLLDMEEKKTDNSINLIKSLETLTEEIKVGNRQKVTEILEQIESFMRATTFRLEGSIPAFSRKISISFLVPEPFSLMITGSLIKS